MGAQLITQRLGAEMILGATGKEAIPSQAGVDAFAIKLLRQQVGAQTRFGTGLFCSIENHDGRRHWRLEPCQPLQKLPYRSAIPGNHDPAGR